MIKRPSDKLSDNAGSLYIFFLRFLLFSEYYFRQIPVKVITIAGIVNTEHYALFHDEELPEGSLNPADESYLSARIPQVHYVGGQDQVMPIAFTKDFVKKLPKPVSAQVKAIPSATHDNWLNYNLDF